MNDLDARMDSIFANAFRDMGNWFDNSMVATSIGKYVVHFYLPDPDTSNVSVNYEDGQLDLIAQEQQNTSNQTANGTIQSSASSRYEETINLPGPVKDKEMTVNRQPGTVTVTLPKA